MASSAYALPMGREVLPGRYYTGQLAIAVLDVFAKDTRETPDDVIRNCKRRLADLKVEGQVMNRAQRKRFERAGWKVGTAGEILGLTEAGEGLVEGKLRLGEGVGTLRLPKHSLQAA